ncbi:hypothetical protein SODALDRAFT_321652 [Sodiomyces alkalinus F11]|uniref:Uncharacterized protein n=1 Tax=Sodiomyces alkalinus (strain CBS 110278 / VKM F-3762 / F11) TaxID=1314773 RepID=A0A3N2Q0H3_SODAK|nr:hypothetical protein SODALDRAFT_321652 [Sodiomyces alkalinus F11]ROT40271.1 hypothetical protein SODALDRAFT_321652 [Sodiomyces alkalinus F11]
MAASPSTNWLITISPLLALLTSNRSKKLNEVGGCTRAELASPVHADTLIIGVQRPERSGDYNHAARVMPLMQVRLVLFRPLFSVPKKAMHQDCIIGDPRLYSLTTLRSIVDLPR